ncbi:hypothetical protein AB0J80_02170 [Actinoplanes sp. NPDC049548]|uniref:hypothetical protein n=1 Tax=Actinoplanes sp. NPDC049548 TaxID=3155152 RepID=UPI00341A6337
MAAGDAVEVEEEVAAGADDVVDDVDEESDLPSDDEDVVDGVVDDLSELPLPERESVR